MRIREITKEAEKYWKEEKKPLYVPELKCALIPWRRHWWQFWKPKFISVELPTLTASCLTEVRPTKYSVSYKIIDTSKSVIDDSTRIITLTKDELLNFKKDWWVNKNNKVMYPLKLENIINEK